MRIIQIVGLANTGKTTFIRDLIPHLKKYGRVAVIKHMRDHEFALENGKDTTVFFESGSDISVGVDSNKSVMTMKVTDLDRMLAFFKYEGIDFTIIEGFKTRNFPKIVIGDLSIERCTLQNPSVDEVIASLSSFEDY